MRRFEISPLVTLLCFVCLFSGFDAVPTKDCGSAGAKDIKLSISGCLGGDRCVLHKGTTIKVTISFTATENATKVTTVVHGIIAGLPIRFPIKNDDACKYAHLTCPLVANKSYTYEMLLPILSTYPSIRLNVEWELHDEKNNKILCLLVPAELESTATGRRRNRDRVDPNVMLFDRELFGV